MSWTTRTGRFLSFLWKSGTTDVQGPDEKTAQIAVENALDSLKSSHPELSNAKKAIVRSKPHSTAKADGKIDPLHAKFQITDAKDQKITSAHSYATPLGGRYVWFSKPKYNDGQEAKEHFPPNPAIEKADDSQDESEK